MDVHGVTDMEEYLQLMTRQKELLRKAKSRQGQRPKDRKSKSEAYMKFMGAMMVKEMKQNSHRGMTAIHSSFIPLAYPPCTTPAVDLRPVTIKDLQLETHHRGTYLLLRSLTPPNRMTGIMSLMEDSNADVILLQLYQQADEEARKAIHVVDEGTVLLVKEPYFKQMADGEYGVRVDHVSDTVCLFEGDARIPTSWRTTKDLQASAESLKLKGNAAVGKRDYWNAITKYSAALRRSATMSEIKIMKCNRALAYLKTKQFDATLVDAGFPDFHRDVSDKAVYRAAEALYNLARFKECSDILEPLCLSETPNKSVLEMHDRSQKRLEESAKGVYDFAKLQAEAHTLTPPQLDHATYVGPIEVKHTKNKGRGLFVIEAVKAGELLLCEKAFSHAFASEKNNENGSKVTFLLNPETNRGSLGTQADLIKQIVQKTYLNSSTARPFTNLYHGDYEGVSTSSVDGEPIVDTFLVDRIVSFNVFGCPRSSLEGYKNAMVHDNHDASAHHSTGIWAQASLINHGCTSTARRSFIGDMMIVRATRDLEPGTEVTFWYHPPFGKTPKELKEKLSNWGFECDCAICVDGKFTSASVTSKRQLLRGATKALMQSSVAAEIDTNKIENIVTALERTFTKPASDVPRLLLWDTFMALAEAYMAQNNSIKCLETLGRMFASVGFKVVGLDHTNTAFAVVKWGFFLDDLIDVFLLTASVFTKMGQQRKMKQAKACAKISYKIVVGEDASFEETYGLVGTNGLTIS